MSENETPVTENQTPPAAAKVLNPVTRSIIERSIQEVLTEYVQQTKHFTADSMHYLRMKVTDLVKQRLGDGEIVSVDLGLDLSSIQDIPFFFKLNIPQDKAENHMIQQPVAPVAPPADTLENPPQ
jgi:hypothetical protein